MKITSIHAEPISGTMNPEVAIVSSLGAHIAGQYVLVRITDDEGRTGLGEASVTSVWSGETQRGTLALIEDVLAPLLISADPFDLEWIDHLLHKRIFANSFAKAAIEMALLDLQGQALGVPVYRLLGGKDPQEDKGIRLKFVIGAVEPDLAAERAAKMVDKGWQAIKVKVGKHEHPSIDLERLHAVRDAIGPETFLSIDANGAFTVEQALWLTRRLEKLNVALFEQPTRRGNHLSMAEVRRESPIPIMADESVFTPQDALEIIRHQSADVMSLYPGKHGGLRTTQLIAKMAEVAGIACTIGSNLEREVATAAMAHVTVCTSNLQCERWPGDLIGPLYYVESLTEESLNYNADRLQVPESAGLGIKL